MHFCFFKSHQLISGSDRTEVHLAKESRKSTIFDRELVSRSLKKTGVFFQTKFNFGHECPQYFIAYKNLNTPKLFLFLHFLILDFHHFFPIPLFLFLSPNLYFLSKIFPYFTRGHETQFNLRSGFSYHQKKSLRTT